MSRPPLPILQTVIAAYTSLLEGFLAFVQIAVGWWILTVIVAMGLSSLAETVAQMQVTVAATIITFTIGAIAAAVSWHRLIVLGGLPVGGGEPLDCTADAGGGAVERVHPQRLPGGRDMLGVSEPLGGAGLQAGEDLRGRHGASFSRWLSAAVRSRP